MNEPRWTRLRNIFRADERTEVGDEIGFHIQMRTKELIDQGVEPARARELAEQRFGPVVPVERELVDSVRRRRHRADRAAALRDLTRDLTFAVRSLRRSPGFTTAAIATFALGVGATLSVFNVVNGVLLRPLPYHDPGNIQMIWIVNRTPGAEGGDLPLASGFYADIERQSRAFASMAAFRAWSYSLSMGGAAADAEPLAGARVSPSLFTVLGVRPQLGQPFATNDAIPGAPDVALISHDLWQRRFGGDAGVVGRRVNLNGQPFTVTGVMPRGFTFPRGAELPATFGFGLRTEVWTPLVFDSTDARNYGQMNLSAVGRLAAPGSALAAQDELSGIMQRFLNEVAPNLKLSYVVRSLSNQAGQNVERALLILSGAVLLVLLIATANVASLLLARTAARQRELVVRVALGASRGRLARQLVTEHFVLAATGTAIGLAIAWWTTQVMLALVPGSMPRADDIGLDWRVLTFAATVSVVAGVVFGLASTVAVRWPGLGIALHEGGQRAGGSRRHRYGRRMLAAAEVALSLMLLIGATLLTRSFISLQRVELGFDDANVVTAEVSIPVAGRFEPQRDGSRWYATLREITTRASSLPGVEAAGMVSSLPLSGTFESGGLRMPGITYEPGMGPSAQYSVVEGDYFAAAGIRVVAGRAFDHTDNDPDRATIVINRVVARELFGSESAAIGRDVIAMFELSRTRPARTVVGVVEVVKQVSADEPPRSQVYVPLAQFTYPGLTLVARTSGGGARDAASLLTAIKREARAVDPAVSVRDMRPLEDVVSDSMARQRFNMTVIGVFAVLALVLAIVGLYGVLALLVGQRRREIGVRLALGAQRWTVVRLILREGLAMALVGVVLGVGGALALTRVLESLVFGISTNDALTFALAAVLVTLVALGATYLPARRASRVDPRIALAGD